MDRVRWPRQGTRREAITRRQSMELMLTGAGAAAVAAACGPGQQRQVDTVAQQPVKIVFGNKFDVGERKEWANIVVAKFNEVNGPKLTAEHIIIAGDALFTAMAAGTGPDVTQTSGSWFSDFADKGQLREVTPFVKRDKIDMNRWYLQEETFVYKGKQYGTPFWQAHSVYFYNVSMFRRNNVPPPNENWTWDNLLDAARRLTKSGESWGINMGYGWEFAWLNFLRSAGGDYINKERTKTTLNTPVALEVMQWLVDLVLKQRVMMPQGDTSLGSGNLWYQGKIAMQLSGTGALGGTLTAKPDFEWDMFVTPKYPKTGKRAISSNENPMVVTNSTKAPEAAWKFVLFEAEKFAQDLVGKFRINMPSLKLSAADPQGWLSTPPPSMRLSLEQMKHAGTLSFHKNWSQWYGETIKQMVPAFKGEIGVKEACEKASQIGDTLLRGV